MLLVLADKILEVSDEDRQQNFYTIKHRKEPIILWNKSANPLSIPEQYWSDTDYPVLLPGEGGFGQEPRTSLYRYVQDQGTEWCRDV